MSTYGTMQTRIADEINRSDLTSQIQYAIQSAIAHYANDHFTFNETQATATTASGTEYYAYPSDLLELDSIVITVNSRTYPLIPRTFQWMEDNYYDGHTGYPTEYATYNKQIRLYPIPNDTFTLKISYLQSLDALSATSDSNFWMTDGEELIRCRAKADLGINVLRNPTAIQEAMGFSARNQEFLNIMEASAYQKLSKRGSQMIATGQIRPNYC